MIQASAAIITIGNELLSGHTIDTNSVWMAERLNASGITVCRRIAVGDDPEAIRRALDESMLVTGLVILTGGLGPTADDITKPVLCEHFGGRLIVNDAVLAHIRHVFERRNLPLLDRNLRQAEVPDNCQVLFNKTGTAPGMFFEVQGKQVFSVPGVPHEMKYMMEEHVLPEIEKRYAGHYLLYRTVVIAGIGESFAAEKIADIEDRLPAHLSLAYTVHFRMLKLRLAGRGEDKTALTEELESFQKAMADRLEPYVISVEENPLEELIAAKLCETGKTLALAESCTGGYMAHMLTQVKGASAFFRGSMVCYQNRIKEQCLGVPAQLIKDKGAVSEEVAVSMATGIQKIFFSDIALGITGLIDGDAAGEDAPPGTVWIALTDGQQVHREHLRLFQNRRINKEIAAQAGLLMIWKYLRQ